MIARNIIVSLCIFSLLQNEHDTYRVKKVLGPALCKGPAPGLVPKTYISFVFYDTFKWL